MRRIFTSSFLAVLLTISLNSNSQTCSALSTTAPGGVTFGAPITVSAANGFTSTGQSTPFTYNSSSTTSITSPIYFYSCTVGNQPTIYFTMTLDASSGLGNDPTPTIDVLSGNPVQTITCSAPSSSVSPAGSGT